MSALYTLTLRRKKLTFHPDGRVETLFVEERHLGMPGGLVGTFKREFPEAFGGAIEEFIDQSQVMRAKPRRDVSDSEMGELRESVRDRTKKARSVLAKSEREEIAGAGGFADAITDAMEDFYE